MPENDCLWLNDKIELHATFSGTSFRSGSQACRLWYIRREISTSPRIYFAVYDLRDQ